jgi:uncharacterized protein (TIGR03032 family)
MKYYHNEENIQPFQCKYSGNVLDLLNKLNISLVLSTYQAGKVIFLSSNGENMFQLVRDFARPMGIAIKDNLMALAGALTVTVFKTDAELAKTYPSKPDTYDAFYFPITLFRTDYVNIHDISFTNQGLIGVNTAFSCLSRLDGQFSFNPIWKPDFIDKFEPKDFCHLNGMALDEKNAICYVTAFGKTKECDEWRKNKLNGGILIDVKTDEIVLENLPMPHSPRIYNGKVYLLLSAAEEFIKVDIENGTYNVIAKIDGFIRGLCFKEKYAFIGVSKLRKTHIFSDLPIAEKEITAGVVIIDINTGKKVGAIKYETNVDELYDVHILDGIKRPNILNYQQSLNHRALITPFGCGWIENNDS